MKIVNVPVSPLQVFYPIPLELNLPVRDSLPLLSLLLLMDLRIDSRRKLKMILSLGMRCDVVPCLGLTVSSEGRYDEKK